MKSKAYYLSTCSTCQSILTETGVFQLAEKGQFTLQDIKTEKITPAQIDEMKAKTGSFESLFSRRALKYKEWGLKDKALTEADYRKYILEEYTFLKRPVLLINGQIFVGNDKKTVENIKKSIF